MDQKLVGILQDIHHKGYYKLEECGPWLCDRLVEIIMLDGSPLITINDSYVVTLTDSGRRIANGARYAIPHTRGDEHAP